MKRILLSAAVLTWAASAQAADLPQTAPYRAPAVVPAFSWTGVYIGANVGYGFGKASAFGLSEDLNGFVGGGQIGANYQMGSFVAGIDADFQGTTQSKSTTFTVLGIGVTEKDSVPWFGSVRGRVGAAFNRVFIYATGGWAYTQFKIEATALGTTVSRQTTTRARQSTAPEPNGCSPIAGAPRLNSCASTPATPTSRCSTPPSPAR